MYLRPSEEAMRVAMFGGSFNPPHIGHALICAWLKWSDEVDQVWLVPCADHPLGKVGLRPFADRVRWCEAMSSTVGPWVRVDTIESSLPRPSYSINTLTALAERHPECSFRLVVGADILGQTTRWREWERIESEFSPIIVGRTGHPAVSGAVVFPEVSSTEVRRVLGRREQTLLLLPTVLSAVGDTFAGARMLRSAALHREVGVAHGFSGRVGCAATPVIDLGPAPRGVERECAWACALRGIDAGLRLEDVVLLDQTHGAGVLVNPDPRGYETPSGAADAAVSTEPGVVLAVRTADCVPILISAPGGVAAIHAGWRGIVAGVVAETVAALCRVTRASTGELVAAIGPHASVDAYETGSSVIDALVGVGLEASRVGRQGPRNLHANLRVAVEDQLAALGVGTIDHVRGCTIADPMFHSYRRDGVTSGRQASLIVRLP